MAKLHDLIPMEKIVARQFRLWERSYEKIKAVKEKPCLPVITISRELGSLGQELAVKVSERLGWRLFDKNLVEFIANDAQVRANMVEFFDEKVQNEIHNWVVTLLDRYALGSDKYFKHLMTVLAGIGEHGRAVIVGRGGNFVFPPEKALRIKVVAPLKMRIETLRRQKNMSKTEAEKYVMDADRARMAFIRRFFHHDAEDPLFYDFVLNLGHLTLPVAEKLVTEALRSRFPAADLT